MKIKAWLFSMLLAATPALVLAVDDTFCNDGTTCVDDKLNVVFDSNNTQELANVNQGDLIKVSITLDVKTFIPNADTPPDPKKDVGIQGFSYGVKHDTAILTITGAQDQCNDPPLAGDITPCDTDIIGGTLGGKAFDVDFETTSVAQDNLGFIQAVVVNLDKKAPYTFPLQDGVRIARSQYTVKAVPADPGSKISFSDELSPPGSPPTSTNLTISGKSKHPKLVGNGVVKGKKQATCTSPDYAFYFGPAASASAFAITGTSVPVSLRNKGIALGFSFGVKKAGANLTFEKTLGSEAGRETELVVTKDTGLEVNGDALKGNSATGATADISDATRGAALTANNPGDFIGVDLIGTAAPDVGGPGVTVGYASDVSGSNKVIPAVTDGVDGTCGVNEVIILKLGGVVLTPFSRGDANGDHKINVTDGVIIAQNIFANKLVQFDCKDMLDVNDDGILNTQDPVFLLTYIFLHGPAPAAPWKTCAADGTTGDPLGCAASNCQ